MAGRCELVVLLHLVRCQALLEQVLTLTGILYWGIWRQPSPTFPKMQNAWANADTALSQTLTRRPRVDLLKATFCTLAPELSKRADIHH